MMYIVERIDEDDYGCEERPEGQPRMVIVTLSGEDGKKETLRTMDQDLLDKDINEGEHVFITKDFRLEKVKPEEKILVMSDSHRNRSVLEAIIRSNIDAEIVVFLGDGGDDMAECLRRIPELSGKDIRIVRGNCDGFSDKPAEEIFEAAGHKFLCTHGHYQNVKRGFEHIAEEAWEKECDIVLYGHTHLADTCDDYQGVILFNPGAVLDGCYGIATINAATGEVKLSHKQY